MITIKTWRDPYDSGFSPTKPTSISFEPGLTVLVGCNGAGKTTLLHNIKEEAGKQDIPCHLYDNQRDGGGMAIGSAINGGNMAFGAALWCSSEGEAIKMNFGSVSTKFKRFLEDGFFDTQTNRIARIFRDNQPDKEICNKRILLFDAVDSGLSVDSVVEIKAIFEKVLKEAEELGVELYLIISANEYELARNVSCFDVNVGRYKRFADYEEYRKFILKSRANKEKRIAKQEIWYENKRKRAEEALAKRKAKYEPLINAIKKQAEEEHRDLTWGERRKIDDYERIIKNGQH